MKNRLGSVIKIKSNLLRDNAERPTAAHSGNFQTEKKTAAYPVGLPDWLQTFTISLN